MREIARDCAVRESNGADDHVNGNWCGRVGAKSTWLCFLLQGHKKKFVFTPPFGISYILSCFAPTLWLVPPILQLIQAHLKQTSSSFSDSMPQSLDYLIFSRLFFYLTKLPGYKRCPVSSTSFFHACLNWLSSAIVGTKNVSRPFNWFVSNGGTTPNVGAWGPYISKYSKYTTGNPSECARRDIIIDMLRLCIQSSSRH